MKAVQMFLAAIVLVVLMGAAIEAITSWRSQDYTAPYIVATGAGVTTSDITLTQDLFNSATANVLIVSNNVLDAPIPFAYVSATHVLTVSGLAASESRTLTLTYKIAALDDYPGADLFARFWPALLLLGGVGLVGGGIYAAYQSGRRDD